MILITVHTDIGERAGSGIPSILYVWKKQGWEEPTITQTLNPNRITLSLPLITSADNKALIKSADNDKKALIKSPVQKELIITYLTDHAYATGAELGELLELRPTRVRTLLRELAAEGIIVAEGGNRNRTYRLKS